MNFLKKGPEIKLPTRMPELRVPDFLSEIYHELDERHLLPLVIVLVVAIVAVPVALSESSQPTAAPATPATGAANASSSGSRIVVAKSLPGLRDYRKRLNGLRAKDPFKQQFANAEAEGAVPSEETPSTVPSEEGSGPSGAGGPPSTSEGGTHTVTHELKYFSWEIDVRIVPVSSNGKPSKAKPTVLRNQPELTMLPGHNTPALIFIGPSSDRKKALMLVSSNVTTVFGDAICVLGGEACEMLALEPGVPETISYGGNQRIFRVELLKISLVETNKLNRAPLGKPGRSNKRSPAPRPQAQVAMRTIVRQPR